MQVLQSNPHLPQEKIHILAILTLRWFDASAIKVPFLYAV